MNESKRDDGTRDTDYVIQTSRFLFDTGEEQQSSLQYLVDPNVPNVFWPTAAVDLNLLREVMRACNDQHFSASTAQRDDVARTTARDAIRAYLDEQNLPTGPWDVTVNGSQPTGGQWNFQSPDRWLHVTYTPQGGSESIAVAPYATASTPPEIRWRVSFMKFVEDV